MTSGFEVSENLQSLGLDHGFQLAFDLKDFEDFLNVRAHCVDTEVEVGRYIGGTLVLGHEAKHSSVPARQREDLVICPGSSLRFCFS